MEAKKFEGKSPEYIKGYEEGQRDVESQMFKDRYYEVQTKELNIESGHEIIFTKHGGIDEVQYEVLSKGCWEVPEPEYDKEGIKLSVTGAICSHCRKYTRYPEKYCPHCGSRNINDNRF